MNNKYTIINFEDISKIDFNEVLDGSIDTVRVSTDNTKCIVKWRGTKPKSLEQIQNKSTDYYNSEILEILESDFWTEIKENII